MLPDSAHTHNSAEFRILRQGGQGHDKNLEAARPKTSYDGNWKSMLFAALVAVVLLLVVVVVVVAAAVVVVVVVFSTHLELLSLPYLESWLLSAGAQTSGHSLSVGCVPGVHSENRFRPDLHQGSMISGMPLMRIFAVVQRFCYSDAHRLMFVGVHEQSSTIVVQMLTISQQL